MPYFSYLLLCNKSPPSFEAYNSLLLLVILWAGNLSRSQLSRNGSFLLLMELAGVSCLGLEDP